MVVHLCASEKHWVRWRASQSLEAWLNRKSKRVYEQIICPKWNKSNNFKAFDSTTNQKYNFFFKLQLFTYQIGKDLFYLVVSAIGLDRGKQNSCKAGRKGNLAVYVRSFLSSFYWSIVDLWYCVSFWYTAKWFNDTYIHILCYIFPLSLITEYWIFLDYTVGPCCLSIYI